MNSLSWMIYLTSLFDGLKVFAGIACFGFTLVVGLRWIGVFIEDASPPAKWVTALPLLCGLLCAVIPDSGTMKAIVASEVGERVIKSERVQGIVDPAMKYVEGWLKDKIKEQNK